MKTYRIHPGLLKAFIGLLLSAASLHASSQDKIVLDGSTGMIPLARALAAAYQQQSREPQIEIGQGLGTGARLKALTDGKIHIAMASHGIAGEDLRQNGLQAVDVAKGAIVFAVNASVPLTNVSQSQACDLFAGKLADWAALNAPGAPVAVLTRPATEVDPEIIRAKLPCFKDLKEVSSARVMARSGDMAKGMAETPNAIGMTSMAVVEQSGGRIRALALDGVEPSAGNVKTGHYHLTRDFLFVTHMEPSPAVRNFMAFVISAAGDKVILESGAIPLR